MAMVESAAAGRSLEPAYLDVVGPDGQTSRVLLSGSALIVGRVAECGLRLDHPMVSRQHARFQHKDGHWWIADLKSHNGTRLNQSTIKDQLLTNGDRVDIGPFTLTFHQSHGRRLRDLPLATPTLITVNDSTVAIRTLQEIQPPHIAVEHLNGLEGFTRLLMETPDAAGRLTALCRLMVQAGFDARWAVAVSIENVGADPAVLSPVQFADGLHRDEGNPYLSRSLLQAACRRREPMLASNTTGGVGGGIELSIAPEVMRITAIAVPLPASAGSNASRVDLLYAVFPPEYGTGEWLALATLAVNHYRQAQTIWANIERNMKLATLEADLERARRVQDRLVPRNPQLIGVDVAVRFTPCHAVGGDYVDVLPLPDGRALLVVADVCGKGLPAAMVAMGLHTLVHAAARRWGGLDDLAATASAHLIETLQSDSFVTFLAMTLDPITGTLEVTNGGHPPALIVNRAGAMRQFGQATTSPLGNEPDPPTVELGQLAEDEMMILFTDGCFDILDATGGMLGPTGFYQHAAIHMAGENSHTTSAADRLTSALDALQGNAPASDDRTMLLVCRGSVAASDADAC